MIQFDDEISIPKLPSINAQFFTPRFLEKPQDPIMDTIKLNANYHLPKELFEQNTNSFPLKESIWLEVAQSRRSSQIRSWDSLRFNAPISASSGGFISEQDDIVFAAAHHQTIPILHDPQIVVQYVSLPDLLKNMKLTALGFSSLLHEWDPLQERFVDIGLDQGLQKRLIVEGKDELISSHLVSRFLHIGTSLRRIETLIASLRSRTNIGPTMHAFAHAISTCLVLIRKSLALGLPSGKNLPFNQLALTAVLKYYDQHKEILTALSVLCKRQAGMRSPEDYESIPEAPQDLLSLIYEHLHNHIERQSSHFVIAIFAFILTNTSTDYFARVSRSIGFGSSENWSQTSQGVPDKYPTFFPPELVNALPIAQKSLNLLEAGQPTHPLLKNSKSSPHIRWIWTIDDILTAVNNNETPRQVEVPVRASCQLPITPTNYPPELAETFRIYDLTPGSFTGRSCFDNAYTSAPIFALDSFIEAFPLSLPPITPTLDHITALVVKPLLLHATTLSNTLLSHFLVLPPPLDIHSHLQLMRSYLLLMSPSFRTRLSAALFSDSGSFDADIESTNTFSLRSLRRDSQRTDLRRKPWAVGFAPALLDRAAWPPMDTDLSFFLRTVILDSFDINDKDETRRSRVEEIENRLGFAVHDETGADAWSDPLRVEALDFLYMNYSPPHPLDVIITPEIVSKYQRIFSFLLRILRVQHAIHAMFRMTNSSRPRVFDTLVASRKILLHFRFIAQSFVTNLVEYVYDTAIAGNLDPFLAKLQQAKDVTGRQGTKSDYSDVFSLAEAHSNIMNVILTACLLRTSQKSASSGLRDALQLVLDAAVLIGDLYRGRIEEYQAAPVLENLYGQFRKKMASLIKVLSGTVDRNVSLQTLLEIPHSPNPQDNRKPVGGIEALSHLLIRLDLKEYWSAFDKASMY